MLFSTAQLISWALPRERKWLPEYLKSRTFVPTRAQSWLLAVSEHSSPIIHLKFFQRTISTNPELRSHVRGANFEWDDSANAQDIFIAKWCLLHLKTALSLLRLALPDFDAEDALTSNVNFLEIVYPDENLFNDLYIDSRYDINLHEGLRNTVYSMFCIPTLRHLSRQHARTWHAFTPLPPTDDLRVGTSNITSLSLPRTVPLSRDLKEMLRWPKALKHFYNHPGRAHFFQNYSTEQLTSPEVFINGLYSQRHTLEELIYNNREDCCGSDGTTFGKALRGFVQLKRMAVTRDSLVTGGEDEALQSFHETFPPNLEEALILLRRGDLCDDEQLSFFKHRLRGIAINKQQCCPSLKIITLWEYERPYSLYPLGYQAEAVKMMDTLNLASTFQEVGILFDVNFGDPTNFGALNLKEYK